MLLGEILERETVSGPTNQADDEDFDYQRLERVIVNAVKRARG